MLLKVSSEGYDYLTELRNIPDPEDEDGFHTLGSDKSEIEAADEMVLQLYSAIVYLKYFLINISWQNIQ